MKKTILILAVTVFMTGTMFTNCKPSANRVENSENILLKVKNKVFENKQDLNKTRQDSIIENQQFKKKSEERISNYEKNIVEIKSRIAKQKKENKAIYEKKLAVLEQKNSNMKKELENYKEKGKGEWNSFKFKLNQDLDELGKAFKDFTVEK